MQIEIPVYLIGGIIGVSLLFVVLWLVFRAIKYAVIWGALGGIPAFKIAAEVGDGIVKGLPFVEIADKIFPTYFPFFLKPIDELLLAVPEPWMIAPFVLILFIWLLLCIGFVDKALIGEWLDLDEIWFIPLGFALLYQLSRE